MATWEDGPEYAPHERPQYYADAPVAPLEQVPPAAVPRTRLPAARPQFDEPSAPVAALATLVPVPPDERDPQRPFDTLTTAMTAGPAWGSSSDESFDATRPLGPTSPSSAAPDPTGAPWPVLEQPALGQQSFGQQPFGQQGQSQQGHGQLAQARPQPAAPWSDPVGNPYQYPSPGTPGWFAPPPTAYGDQRTPGRVDAKQVVEAATPGLCICLAVGGLIYVLAPVMLVVAVFLSMRVQVAQRAVRIGFRLAAAAVAFFAVVGLFRMLVDDDPWWSFVAGWSAGVCWVMLAVLLLVVRRALTRPSPPPPTTNPWG